MPSRGELFIVVGVILIAYGLFALESFAGSFGALLRGQPDDRAWILILAGILAIGWGILRLRLVKK